MLARVSHLKGLASIASQTLCSVDQIVTRRRNHTDVDVSNSPKQDYQPTVPDHIKSIAESIAQLKFYEISLLNGHLRKTLNIPDAPVAVVQAGTGAASADDDEVQGSAAGVKTQFTVKLTKFDESKKVSLIKEIKKLVEGINLVEAKRFVEDCPKVIRNNLTKDEAEALKKQLEEAGGVVSVD